MAGKIVPLPNFPECPDTWPKLSCVFDADTEAVLSKPDSVEIYRYQMLKALYRLKGVYMKYQLVHEYFLQNKLHPEATVFDVGKAQHLSLCILWDFEALLSGLDGALGAAWTVISQTHFSGVEHGRDMGQVARDLILEARKSWGTNLGCPLVISEIPGSMAETQALRFVKRSSGWRLQFYLPDEKSKEREGLEVLNFGLKTFRKMSRLDSALSRLIRKYRTDDFAPTQDAPARAINA